MGKYVVSASPHITKRGHTTRKIMLDVLIALAPALIAAILFFGFQVLINAVVCMGACFGTEMLYDCIKNKKFSKEVVKKSTAWDFSSLVTGLILALNLPSKMAVKGWDFNIYSKRFQPTFADMSLSIDVLLVGIIGSIFAIMVVKMLFGGIGRNFMNPAAAARVFLFLAIGLGVVNTVGVIGNVSTGATWLGSHNNVKSNTIVNYLIGNRGTAAVGETSIVAILLGYIYLSVRKVIDFRLPLVVIGSAAIFAIIFEGLKINKLTAEKLINNTLMHVLSGGLVFGAVFMATDYSSSPNSFWGKVVFGAGIGLFTVIIRVFASYPEGMSFAILIMNVATPLIDKYIFPRPFGFVKPAKKKEAGTVKQPQKIKQSDVNHSDKNNSEVSV